MIKPTILVVDDDKEFTDIFVDFLNKSFNAEIILKDNANDAIKVIDKQRVDVLFQDIRLPNGPNGLAVVRHIKEVGKSNDIFVYIISRWHNNDSYDIQMRDLKVNYLPQPISFITVRSLLNREFERSASKFDYKKVRG